MPALSRPKRLLLAVLLVALLLFFYGRDGRSSAPSRGPLEVLNSTLGFQEIFVINLPERTDRRDAMTLAAAVTDLSLTFIPGVRGADVQQKVLPPSERSKNENWTGKTGSWRAHMNVLQRIVQENITSALILEDDADWDVRVKSQAQTVARASQAYLQPLKHDPSHSLSTLHAQSPPSDPVDLVSTPPTVPPQTPYGDAWDVLWLGHIGSHLPTEPHSSPAPASPLALFTPDPTVALPHHLKRHPFASKPDHFASLLPPHSRVLHASRGTVGVQAYAVSQRGARRLLHLFGLERFDASYDLMLRDWCDGGDGSGEGAVCVATQPPLFSQWYSSGGSDIHGVGGGYFRGTGSTYVRLSVMLNLGTLAAGKGEAALMDQWPDDGEGPW